MSALARIQDPDTVAAYYKDGAALFTITVSDAQRAEAVAAIDALLGDAGALTGSAVSTAAATNSTVVEVAKIDRDVGEEPGGVYKLCLYIRYLMEYQ